MGQTWGVFCLRYCVALINSICCGLHVAQRGLAVPVQLQLYYYATTKGVDPPRTRVLGTESPLPPRARHDELGILRRTGKQKRRAEIHDKERLSRDMAFVLHLPSLRTSYRGGCRSLFVVASPWLHTMHLGK